MSTQMGADGVEPRKLAPTADWEDDEWSRILGVDLRGVFLCMKYEIPHGHRRRSDGVT
jgi:NAD(P)-dependent dehydrogenase (short-subunit alcohol dehydrogenase family)